MKTLYDIFPWASALKSSDPYPEWQRYSDGWLVFLSVALDNSSPSYIKLTIGDLRALNTTQVDVLAVMKTVNPEVYREWIEQGTIEDLGSTSYTSFNVTRCYFHVQEGMALVGLKATKKIGDTWVREK